MPSNPLIGIVVPIYNVESYLKECLDSILNQTYQHFVVALINDGSTDSSLNIALEYVRKDKRFILFDKTNAGLSSARNVGIDYFSGKYNFAKKDSDFIITNDNPYNISRVYGECVLDSKDSLLDSKEIQNSKESQRNSSDLHPQNDDSIKEWQGEVSHVNNTNSVMLSSSETSLQNLDSKDSSPDISPHNQDSKITAESKQNSTEESTNTKQIDYIIFLDSDDYWKSNCLESCVKCSLDKKIDIVWFDWEFFYDGIKPDKTPTTLQKQIKYEKDTIETNIEFFSHMKKSVIYSHYCSWSLFIRFKYLMKINLRFKDGIVHEDNIFNIYLLAKSNYIYIHTQPLYTYRIRQNSIMHATSLPPYLAELCVSFDGDIAMSKKYHRVYSLIEIEQSYIDILGHVDRSIAELICFHFNIFDWEIRDFLKTLKKDPLNIKNNYEKLKNLHTIFHKKFELENLLFRNISFENAALQARLDNDNIALRKKDEIVMNDIERIKNILESELSTLREKAIFLQTKADFADEVLKNLTKARKSWYRGGYLRFYFKIKKLAKQLGFKY